MQKLEKPKFKHNKKRNTAFLFETLIKELTKSVVHKDVGKQKIISGLLKEHFKKSGVLDRELVLYKQFYETRKFPKEHAEKLVKQVMDEHEKLDENEIYNEQSKLIAKVNKMLGFEVYNNFVPNYKTIATVSQIFNKAIEPKKRVLLEHELVQHIVGEDAEQKAAPELADKVVYNRFVERFNETYSQNLLPEQKKLLSRYILSSDSDIEMKLYLNEEIGRLLKEIKKAKSAELIKENADLDNKIDKMYNSLTNLKIEAINEELIKKVMLIQQFVSEVNG